MARTPILVYVCCDIELGNMTLATNHDTPFGHGQYMWKILSTSNMVLRSYGPEKTWTCIQLDGQGDRQTVRVIPI